MSSFWDHYKIFNSPGDGHCLLYSVVTSYNNQLDRVDKLSINNLKHIMYKEVQDNFYINYHEFCVNPSYDDFYKELGEYLECKRFNSTVGDMSPLIIAKALNIGIIICESVTVDNVKDVKLHHMNCSRETNNGIIVIYKNGMHYDAIVHTMMSAPSCGTDNSDSRVRHRPISQLQCAVDCIANAAPVTSNNVS